MGKAQAKGGIVGSPVPTYLTASSTVLGFGRFVRDLPVSSIKGAIGRARPGAASAIEAATCVKVPEEQIIPPTINYRPDPDLDLDYDSESATRPDRDRSDHTPSGSAAPIAALSSGAGTTRLGRRRGHPQTEARLTPFISGGMSMAADGLGGRGRGREARRPNL